MAGGKLLGGTSLERSHCDQWLSYMNTTIKSGIVTIENGIFGNESVSSEDFNNAMKELKK